MCKRLYYLFHVSSYKGGELYSDINLTLEDVVDRILDHCQWDDELIGYIIDCNPDETSLSEDKLEKEIPKSNWIDYLSDENIKEFSRYVLYPGNIYAYDTYSDYECYVLDDGALHEIDPTDEPEFCNILREIWKEISE